MSSNSSNNKDTNSNSSNDIAIGRTRVRDGRGHRGTVVYVGPVASAPPREARTAYAGIVWDDPERGRHSGTVLDRTAQTWVRHFSAAHPTGGSFVKLTNLDAGRPLTVAALRERYVVEDDAECVAPGTVLPHAAQTASGRNDKPIELLGELQIRRRQQLRDLTTVSLRLAGLSSVVAVPSSLEQQQQQHSWSELKNVREMDLAGNLLCDWKHVWTLLGPGCLPQLRKLSLAANRLGDWHPPPPPKSGTAEPHSTGENQNLRHLNLNETNIQKPSTVLALGRALPSLRELVLANNNTTQPKFILVEEQEELPPQSPTSSLSSCSSSQPCATAATRQQQQRQLGNNDDSIDDLPAQLAEAFPNLVFLDCSNCTGLFSDPVRAWSELPLLQSLSLDDNPDITRFSQSKDDDDDDNNNENNDNDGTAFYPALRHLQFAGTGLARWRDAEPAWRQRLTSLRLRGGPLRLSSRTVMIARLPQLQRLNASAVTAAERREAARWCLRHQQQQQQLSNDDDDDDSDDDCIDASIVNYWKAEYPELAAAAADARHSPTSATTFTSSSSYNTNNSNELTVVNVTIRSMAVSSCTMEPLVRRLPTGLTVAKVKALCARQFGLDRDLQALHCRRGRDDGFPELLDRDDRTLDHYGVPDGAELLVHEVDVAAERGEAAAAAARQQADRVAAQERELLEFQQRQKRAAAAAGNL